MKLREEFSAEFKRDFKTLRRFHPDTVVKLHSLVAEIIEHPFTGTGHPHPYTRYAKCWARRIRGKHRILYLVDNGVVKFLRCLGHYDDH